LAIDDFSIYLEHDNNDNLIEYGEIYDVLCKKAIALFELKKYDEAEEIYRKILKAGSNSECAINGMGVLLERKGLHKEAINILIILGALQKHIIMILKVRPMISIFHLN